MTNSVLVGGGSPRFAESVEYVEPDCGCRDQRKTLHRPDPPTSDGLVIAVGGEVRAFRPMPLLPMRCRYGRD